MGALGAEGEVRGGVVVGGRGLEWDGLVDDLIWTVFLLVLM